MPAPAAPEQKAVGLSVARVLAQYRLPKVAAAMGVTLRKLDGWLYVEILRGQLRDIHGMQSYFWVVEPGRYGLVILDALWMLPVGADENDNGAMAQVYNTIDDFVDVMGAPFALVHHSSKGIQAGKAVTDVSSGAGRQSRATDAPT